MNKAISIGLLLLLAILPATIAKTEVFTPAGGFEGFIRDWISVPGTVVFEGRCCHFSVPDSNKLIGSRTVSSKPSGINSVRDYRYVILNNNAREELASHKAESENVCFVKTVWYEHLYNPCLQAPVKISSYAGGGGFVVGPITPIDSNPIATTDATVTVGITGQ